MTSSTQPPTLSARVSLVAAIFIIGFGAAFGGVAAQAWRQARAIPPHSHSVKVAKPDDPGLARWIPTAIFGSFSLLLVLLGTRTVIIALRLQADRRWLGASGIRVIGVNPRVDRTELGNTRRMLSTRPYVIVVQWRNPRDGRLREFTSDPILTDPQPSMVNRQTVEVLIDPDAPQRYWVDTSFLPPFQSSFRFP